MFRIFSLASQFIDQGFSHTSNILECSFTVISRRHIGASRQYLKQGCPSGLRKEIWKTIFDIEISHEVFHLVCVLYF